MTNKERYTAAARELANNEGMPYHDFRDPGYACIALERFNMDCTVFLKIFTPNKSSKVSYESLWGFHNLTKNRLARTIALLFMAEMEGDV